MKPQFIGDVDHIDPRLDAISDGLYRVSAKAIIVRDRQLLMSHEPEGWYSVPGGGMKHGASVEDTIKRELQEELGINPDHIRVDPEIIASNFGFVMYGFPRANLYFRVHINDDTEIHDSELGHLWATREDLDDLHVSPATSTLIDLLKSLL